MDSKGSVLIDDDESVPREIPRMILKLRYRAILRFRDIHRRL